MSEFDQELDVVELPRHDRFEGSFYSKYSHQRHRASTLRALGLSKSYNHRPVVKDVSINFSKGEAVGILGPNGAGKTTVFYMITGLVLPETGTIELDGHDVTKLPMYRRARLGIGYLPQDISIFRGLSVEQNIFAITELVESDRTRRKEQVEKLLEDFSITHLAKKPAISLSGGERRRVEMARALASQPSFVLLDEPFAGIDPITMIDMQIMIRQMTSYNIGVLITDHNVRETLGFVDRAYIMYSGELLTEGAPEEIIANSAVRKHYLGDSFSL